MIQVIEGKVMYVVDFATMPELPIIALDDAESTYETLMTYFYGRPYKAQMTLGRYASSLTHAFETNVITEPGKYGVHLVDGKDHRYEIFKINE